jgi:drug/metabolite transporter (DMT)-like permease
MALNGVGYGLASALSWGTGDFIGGLASRRLPVISVVLVSQCFGLTGLLILAVLSREAVPTTQDILWSAAAGIVGQIGLFSLYSALAIGQMSIAAPITAVLAAALPVLFGMATQGVPGGRVLLGFGVALVGVWFLSRPEGKVLPKGLGFALLGGLGFGSFYILLGQVSEGVVFAPAIIGRITTITTMILISLVRRKFTAPPVRILPLLALGGIADTGGNVFFILAEQAGRLDVASVLSSLYPATTVLLALIILRDRLNRAQIVGILLALCAIPLIAAPH